MNSKSKKILIAALSVGLVSVTAGCGASEESSTNVPTETTTTTTSEEPQTTTTSEEEVDEIYKIYLKAKEAGFDGTYEEWLETIKGEDGKDGASILYGESDPTDSQGKDGDFYLNVTSWDVFVKTEGTWTKVGNILGKTGKDGEDGKDGATILTGEGEPNEEDGKVGDIYIDTETGNYYKKTAEGWELLGSLKGKDGERGDDGDDGDDGLSAYQIYVKYHPDYEGSEEQWLDDLVNGRLGDKEEEETVYHTVRYYLNYRDGAKRINADLVDGTTPSYTLPEGAEDYGTYFTMKVEDGKHAVRPVAPSIAGYSFDGWAVASKDAANSYYYEPFYFMSANIVEDISLYALWNANEYTYTTHIGDETQESTVKYGEKLDLGVAESDEGIFSGWYTSDGEEVTSSYLYAQDMDFYAHFASAPEDLLGFYVDDDENYQITITSSTVQVVYSTYQGEQTLRYKLATLTEDGDATFTYTDSTSSGTRLHTLELTKEGTGVYDVKAKYQYLDGTYAGNTYYEYGGSNGFSIHHPYEVSSVTLKASKTTVNVGDVVTLTTTFNPTNAYSQYKEVEVKVYDEDDNEVSDAFDVSTLTLTALKAGTYKVNVVVTHNEVTSNTLTLTVNKVVRISTMEFESNSYVIMTGKKLSLSDKLVIEGEDGEDVNEKSLTYTVNDTSIASINASTGELTAKNAGVVTVTVTDSVTEKTATTHVQVLAKEVNVIPGTYKINVVLDEENPVEATMVITSNGTLTLEYEDEDYSGYYSLDVKLELVNIEVEGDEVLYEFKDSDDNEANIVLEFNTDTMTYSSYGEIVGINDYGASYYSEFKLNVPKEVLTLELDTTNVTTTFTVGDTFSYDGLVVNVNSSYGYTISNVGGYTISVVDMSTAGEKVITVTYNGLTATYVVTVKEGGTSSEFNIAGNSYSGYDNDAYGDITLTIDNDGKTAKIVHGSYEYEGELEKTGTDTYTLTDKDNGVVLQFVFSNDSVEYTVLEDTSYYLYGMLSYSVEDSTFTLTLD